jgi:hypothetical protein
VGLTTSEIEALIVKHALSLQAAVGIGVDAEKCLTTLPVLLDGYMPSQACLPLLIVRLAQSLQCHHSEEKTVRSIAQVFSRLSHSLLVASEGNAHSWVQGNSLLLQIVSCCRLWRAHILPWLKDALSLVKSNRCGTKQIDSCCQILSCIVV